MFRRMGMAALALAVIAGSLSLGSPVVQADAAGYYVAMTGDDANPGTEGAPFRTIQKAAEVAQAGDTVIIREGTYRETVQPANSGTSGNVITYQAYEGEEVIVSGADELTGAWSVHSGPVYEADVDLELGADNQVFVNGEMMVEARWPNVADQEAVLHNPQFGTAASASLTQLSDAALTQADGYYVGARVWVEESHHWVAQTSEITSSSVGSITYDAVSNESTPGAGSRYFIYGKLELLDAAKEWYYAAGKLYLQTSDGESPTGVEVKKRQYAFDLADRSYIRIKGLQLFASTINTSNSSNNIIDGIDAKYVAHTNTPGYAWGDETTGILIRGNNNVLKNSTIAYSSGNCIVVAGAGNSIVNNEIHECNYNGTDDSGIYISSYYTAPDTLIAYNTIYNTGRGAILPKTTSRVRIAYNDISHFSTLMDDAGAIYVFRTDGGGSEIDHNYIHDGDEGIVSGIYLDNGSSNYLVHHNVIWNVPYALYLNPPNHHTMIYNNTLFGEGTMGGSDWYDTQLFNNITGAVSPSNFAVFGHNLHGGVTDARFVDAPAGNFRLAGGSPAIDRGKVVAGVTDGYVGSAPDIGAYESGGADWTAGHNFATPPSMAFALTNTSYRNLIQNSEFESDLTAWTTTNAQAAATDAAVFKSGWRSVKLSAAEDGIEQLVTGLSPNTTYTLSGWAKVDNGDTSVRLGVRVYGGDEQYEAFNTTAFERKSLTFTTGAGDTSATVFFYRPAGGTANAYGDAFGLTPEQPEKSDFFIRTLQFLGNIVTNPGFELGFAGWESDWSNSAVTTETAHVHSGARAMIVGPDNGGRLQQIAAAAKSGETYRLGGWMKITDPSYHGFLGLSFVDANGGFIVEHKLEYSNLEYEFKELIVKAPDNAAVMNVFVFRNGSGGYIYADDISLEPAVPEYQDNIVVSPGFEDGYEGWDGDWGHNVLTTEAAHVHSGTQAIEIGTGNGGRQQKIAASAKPGEAYRLSGWMKITDPGYHAFLGLSFETVDGGFISEHKLEYGSTDYEYKELVVAAPENAAVMYVYVFKNGTGGYAYADDIALQPAVPEYLDNIVASPGFEDGYTGWGGDWGHNVLTTEAVHVRSGTQAIEIGTGNGGRQQKIASSAMPGLSYRVSGWMKITNPSYHAFLGLSFEDAAGGFISEHKLEYSGTDYEYKELIVEAPANAAAMYVYVFKNGTEGYAYADDISLQRGFSAAFDMDNTAPEGTIVIDNGASATYSTVVALSLAATDTGGTGVDRMRFSADHATWTDWEDFAASRSYSLTSAYGVKTVYVQYRDVAGNVSLPFSDTIELQQDSSPTPTPTSTPALTPTPNAGGGTRPADTGSGSTVQIDITRNVQNGVKVDGVKVDARQTKDIVSQAVQSQQSAIRIGIGDVADDPADEVEVDISQASLAEIAAAGLSLELLVGDVLIAIPAATLKQLEALGTSAYFRVAPIRKPEELQAVVERTGQAAEIQQAAGGNEVEIMGIPMIIETNYTDSATKIMFPLNGLPDSEDERQALLDSLAVYIEHSDGEKKLVKGRIVNDANGNPLGIEIEVTKFSTFTIVSIKADHPVYVEGYPDGTFKPNRAITRAEFGAMLAKLLPEQQLTTPDAAAFTDVSVAHWAANAIAQLKQLNLLKGYPDGSFHPDAAITRAEVAAIVQLLKQTVVEHAGSGFPDTDHHWAAAAIQAVQQTGFMKGYPDGTFKPERALTRAESVVLLNRLFGIRPAVMTNPASSWSDVPADHWALPDIHAASH